MAETGCQDRARDGFQHLQAAAHELIQAARALLDVAEDLVDDPATLGTLVGAVDALRDAARRRPADDGDDRAEPGGGETTIERITVA
jgi:hypothetical protein